MTTNVFDYCHVIRDKDIYNSYFHIHRVRSWLSVAVLGVLSGFAVILQGKRKLAALSELGSCCFVTVGVVRLYFLAVP